MTDEFISPSNLKRHHTSISCYVECVSDRIDTKYLWEWKTISNSTNLNELIHVMLVFRIDWGRKYFSVSICEEDA